MRTWPDAVAGLAGDGLEPGAAPLPLQGSHSPSVVNSIFDGVAEHGLLEVELQVVAQVGAAKHLRRAAAAAAAEDVAEHIAEDVAERVRGAEAAAAAARREALVAVLIVDGALLRVGQHFVGFLGLLEFFFGLVIVGIAVGMKFHRQAAIGLLDLGFRRGARDVEHLVVIALGHVVIVQITDLARPETAAG